MKVTWPVGREIKKVSKFCEKYSSEILGGTLLAIDPSSKSLGWAIFKQGELCDSGTYSVSGAAHLRLQKLSELLDRKVDVLAIEQVRGRPHYMLYWSVGMTIAAVKTELMIEVPISFWKVLAKLDENYTKTDENDAIKMGEVIVTISRQVTEVANKSRDAAALILGGRK